MGCTCCHHREDSAPRALVTQEQLRYANPTGIGTALEGLCGRSPAFSAGSGAALDRPAQREFLVGTARLCGCIKPRLRRCGIFNSHSF